MVLLFHKNDIILLYCSNKYTMKTVPYCFFLHVLYLVYPNDEVAIQNIQMYKDIGFYSKSIMWRCVRCPVVVHKACIPWLEVMNFEGYTRANSMLKESWILEVGSQGYIFYNLPCCGLQLFLIIFCL